MSREKKYTKGQWVSENNGYFFEISIKDENGFYSESICGLTGDCLQQLNEANANLISAAPDLLEALEGMIDVWVTVCDCNGHDPNHVAQFGAAHAAIAKAYGDG